MDTFAIITTEPNELVVEKTGHDRMPLIIRRQDYQRWLEPGNEEQPPVDLIGGEEWRLKTFHSLVR